MNFSQIFSRFSCFSNRHLDDSAPTAAPSGNPANSIAGASSRSTTATTATSALRRRASTASQISRLIQGSRPQPHTSTMPPNPSQTQMSVQAQSTDEPRANTPQIVHFELDLQSEYEYFVDTPSVSPPLSTLGSEAGASGGELTQDDALDALELGHFEEAFEIDAHFEDPVLDMQTFVDAALTEDNDIRTTWVVDLAKFMHDRNFSRQHIGEFINALIKYQPDLAGNPSLSEKGNLINALFTNMRPFIYEHIDLLALNRSDKLRFMHAHLGPHPSREECLSIEKQQLLHLFEARESEFSLSMKFGQTLRRFQPSAASICQWIQQMPNHLAAILLTQHMPQLRQNLDHEGSLAFVEMLLKKDCVGFFPFLWQCNLPSGDLLNCLNAHPFNEEQLLYLVDQGAFAHHLRDLSDPERLEFAQMVDRKIETNENRSLFFQICGKLGVDNSDLLLTACARVYLHLLSEDFDSKIRAASLSAPEINLPWKGYRATPSVDTAKALLPKILDLRAKSAIPSPASPGNLFLPIGQRDHPELVTTFNQIFQTTNDADPKANLKQETLAECYLYCVASLSLSQGSTVPESDVINSAKEMTERLRPFLDSISNMHFDKERSRLTGILASHAIGSDNTFAAYIQDLLGKKPKFPPLVIALVAIYHNERLPEPLMGLLGNQRWKKTDHFNAVLTSSLAISASTAFTPEQKKQLMGASFAPHPKITHVSSTTAQDFQRHMYIIKAALSLFPEEEKVHGNSATSNSPMLEKLLSCHSPKDLKDVERELMRELLQLHDEEDDRVARVRSNLLSEFRHPEELLLYLAKLKSYLTSRPDQRPQITLAKWINAYFRHDSHENAERGFEVFRNDFAQSPQLAYLDKKYGETFPETLAAWHQPQSPVDVESSNGADGKKQPPKYFAIETIKATDILTSGIECEGSCQSLDGDPGLNIALLGYATDGKTRMLAIKPKAQKDSPTIARRLLRIMEMKSDRYTGPAIMLEQLYKNPGFDETMDEALIALAKNKAKQMNCPLMIEDSDDSYTYFNNTLFAKLAGAGVEYIDALGDKIEGKSYEVGDLSMIWGPDTIKPEKDYESDDLSEPSQ